MKFSLGLEIWGSYVQNLGVLTDFSENDPLLMYISESKPFVSCYTGGVMMRREVNTG